MSPKPKAKAKNVEKVTDTVAGFMRRVRERLGLSQTEVGEEMDLSGSEVSRLESGERQAPLERLEAWAAALNVRMELLLWPPAIGMPPGLDIRMVEELDEAEVRLVVQLASSIKNMPEPVRVALMHQFAHWRAYPLRDRVGA